MAALVQTKLSPSARFFQSGPSRPRLVTLGESRDKEPREFPEASRPPTLPLSIRDEMLELYAFKFRQGGFHNLGMTFEQFLLVAAALKPHDLADARDGARLLRAHRARTRGRQPQWALR